MSNLANAMRSAPVQAGIVAERKLSILRRISAISPLSDEEREALSSSISEIVERHAGRELIANDALLDEPAFVLSGWVCRAVSLPDGRRQILDFYIPGDLLGYSSRPGARAKASYLCLTSATVANAGQLIRRTRENPGQYPGLNAAWRAIEDEVEAGLIDQIVRTGRMHAHERMIHLISNLYFRHQRAGIALNNGFVMPLTQETLGDALGLSTVHVNRVLQQLRREQTIRTAAGRIEVTDPESLAAQTALAH